MSEQNGGVTADMLENFHFSRDPRGGPYSVCMQREDAETVSFTHVAVTTREIQMFYLSRKHLAPGRVGGERVALALP